MNAKLSLHNREPSLHEQFLRLEAFQIALKEREEKIAALEADRTYLENELKISHEQEHESYKHEKSMEQRLTNAQQQLKDAETEIKRLRALDPERLKIQVKRLQKEKAKAAAGAQELRTKNQHLTKQNRQLNIALDKAIADANAGMELKPAQIFEQARIGRWELFTCAKDGWYQILDTENEVSQTVRVEAGNLVTPKIRPVPKAIAAEVLKFHQEYFGGAV
ncbi:hypothetical protein [Nitrincola iocasae]|uniref:Uncharacterized protein n=1 Tax=Nitrincola iocasae TaxID=2614693 RepID=A0A5J6LCC8_9GAMM|nr:hypothetical protein [Nitrincola iocasae]QEW06334.1 hypothetical protein F5I99_07350 [Nitrincola iocasae]